MITLQTQRPNYNVKVVPHIEADRRLLKSNYQNPQACVVDEIPQLIGRFWVEGWQGGKISWDSGEEFVPDIFTDIVKLDGNFKRNIDCGLKRNDGTMSGIEIKTQKGYYKDPPFFLRSTNTQLKALNDNEPLVAKNRRYIRNSQNFYIVVSHDYVKHTYKKINEYITTVWLIDAKTVRHIENAQHGTIVDARKTLVNKFNATLTKQE